ncbi:MAG: caspase family protein [Pyrinomonadaceae bacterium]|nr:caspase family protein [Pyrinomonadaceae bacterium]
MKQKTFNRSPIASLWTRMAASLAFSICFLCAPSAYTQTNSRGLGLPPSTPVRQLPNKTKRFAVIIGVDKYADTQITTLGGATNDAKSLVRSLVTYAGFPSDQVTLLASDQPAERQPTRGNILRRLSNLAAAVPKDGLLLFAFAGHGIERGGQAFLLPSDAQVSDDVDLLEQTAINVTQVKDRIRKAGIGQVLMILDACRNDPVGRANADNPLTPAYTRGFNFDVRNREVVAFATLYATAVGRRAYEYKEKHQGYFTWALVEGLKGGAANERGEVTLGSLVRYLQERVPKKVLLDLGAGKEQRPFAVVEGYRADDLILSAPGQRSTTASNTTAETETTPEPRTQEESPRGNEALNLAGTTWTGTSVEAGEFTIELLKDGKIRYTIRTGSVGGTWKQSGNFVQIVVGNGYSVLEGTLENGVMKISGTNQEGAQWRWTLMQKK